MIQSVCLQWVTSRNINFTVWVKLSRIPSRCPSLGQDLSTTWYHLTSLSGQRKGPSGFFLSHCFFQYIILLSTLDFHFLCPQFSTPFLEQEGERNGESKRAVSGLGDSQWEHWTGKYHFQTKTQIQMDYKCRQRPSAALSWYKTMIPRLMYSVQLTLLSLKQNAT